MDETAKQEVVEQTERTFTQKELDAILGERLSREREKYADYDVLKEKALRFDEAEEANKTELQKAQEKVADLQTKYDGLVKANEVRNIRDRVAKEYGIPVNLLTAENEDSCIEQAKSIVEFAKPQGYPQVKDTGEVRGNLSGKTSEQFADWFSQNANIH